MRKLNRILLLFLAVLLVFMVGIWEFLQTDSFGTNLSKNLNRLTKSQLGVEVSFENLEFQLFPPGANLNHVDIKVQRKEIKATASMAKLGLYFNLLDTFRTKLTIKELYVEDAVFVLDDFEKRVKESEQGKNQKVDVDRIVREAQESLPFNVEKALVRDLLIKANAFNQYVSMASLSTLDKGLLLKGDVRNIDLSSFSGVSEQLDQVKVEATIVGDDLLLQNAQIKQGINKSQFSGKVLNYLDSPVFDLKGSLQAEIREFNKFYDYKKIGKLNRGFGDGEFIFTGTKENYSLSANVDLKDFDTDFVYGDRAKVAAVLTPDNVTLKSAFVRAGSQELKFIPSDKKGDLLYDLTAGRFTRSPLRFRAEKLSLSNALKYLERTLSPLNANLSGDIKFSISDNGVRFYSEERIQVENLLVQTGKRPLLQAENATLISPSFSIVDGTFFMDVGAKIRETEFKALGRVEDGEMEFIVNDGRASLEELGPFAGLNIGGRGKFNLAVKGKGRNTKMKIGAELSDFNFEEFKLERAKADLVFDFAQSEINIEKVVGIQGKADVNGSATINYSNLDVKANGILKSKGYGDVKKILYPLLGGLEVIPEDISGNWIFGFEIGGKASLQDLIVNGKFEGRNNYVYDESFESIGFNLGLKNQKLTLENIFARKSNGFGKGSFAYDLLKKRMDYDLSVQNMSLSEILAYSKTPFAFDAVFSGRVSGQSAPDQNKTLVDLKLSKTNLGSKKYPDSSFNLAYDGQRASYDVKFLDDMIQLSGALYTGGEQRKSPGMKAKSSFAKLDINIKDIKTPLELLKFVDRNSLELEGGVSLEADSSFDGTAFTGGDLRVNLKEFSLLKGDPGDGATNDISLAYKNKSGPQFIVSNGEITRWDLAIKGQRAYITSKGSGDLKSRYDIANQFKIDAGILEVFNGVVGQASGTLRSKIRFYRDFLRQDYDALVLGDGISISSDKLPTAITSAGFKVNYKDKKVNIESFRAKLAAGEIYGGGKIGLNGLFPDVDLRLFFKDAGFPILRKSNLVVSGEAQLLGNKLPYALSGEVKVNKLLLMNEITEFKQGQDKAFTKEYDYLPQRDAAAANSLVNMNVAIETIDPIILSNSLADVGVIGNAQVIGGEQDFRVVGKFSLAPRSNKVFFKSNEYTLSKANIFFYQRNKVSNPELDIEAHSVINDYRVNIKVFGPVEHFKMELSSQPALTQQDILSLIAFGYTKDLSENLSEEEKESMTTAGVGSLIFDSFKINETLKNEFGLQVNLGTQIQQQNQSYLARGSNDSALGRVSSATTIEVKKQLSDAMNLSVTSTVGGSIGQKQSMNLNYNINNKLSVEGVYSTRTSDEGDETINDSSLGADVKIRWSFK